MCLNSALISIFLFISVVLSDQPWFPGHVTLESTNGASDDPYYSDISSGAFLEETDKFFTSATATFNIAASGQLEHGYAVLVSIDATSCPNSWLAAGVSAFAFKNSKTIYAAWYEWGRDEQYLSDIAITANDAIRTSVIALSTTSGAVFIENLNTGQASVYYLNGTQPLCERDVFWGVRLSQADESIPFDTVTITNAMAFSLSGSMYEAEGANKMVIKRDDEAVTSVETNGSTVTIQHVHE